MLGNDADDDGGEKEAGKEAARRSREGDHAGGSLCEDRQADQSKQQVCQDGNVRCTAEQERCQHDKGTLECYRDRAEGDADVGADDQQRHHDGKLRDTPCGEFHERYRLTTATNIDTAMGKMSSSKVNFGLWCGAVRPFAAFLVPTKTNAPGTCWR